MKWSRLKVESITLRFRKQVVSTRRSYPASVSLPTEVIQSPHNSSQLANNLVSNGQDWLQKTAQLIITMTNSKWNKRPIVSSKGTVRNPCLVSNFTSKNNLIVEVEVVLWLSVERKAGKWHQIKTRIKVVWLEGGHLQNSPKVGEVRPVKVTRRGKFAHFIIQALYVSVFWNFLVFASNIPFSTWFWSIS